MSFKERIDSARRKLGDSLVIFGHHYQDDSVIQHVDKSGDSLELARLASKTSAEHIVFCGVHFMGESAAVLAKPGQKVYLPAPDADCPMAQMAPEQQLDAVLKALTSGGRKVVPLTYVNSSMAVKAVCARYGGSVCTSSNAEIMLRWAYDQADSVLFIPDKMLGRNMAKLLGIPSGQQYILNIIDEGKILEELGNPGKIENSALLLWPGYCPIHADFLPEHIEKARRDFPNTKILVHPECAPEVVDLSDFAGSTSAIIKYVAEAPAKSVIGIGTEIRLVERLRKRYAGEKEIFPLLVSECEDMTKVNEANLAATLENIIAGTAIPLAVDPVQAGDARKALQTMLDVCKL